MPQLFSPLTIRDITLRNRTVVAPMCQYSAKHGFSSDWHLVHLGRFALGGFGAVILEATAVTPEGRISYGDLGLWRDEHIGGLARIAAFLKEQGAAAGIQLAHAGRKASTPVSWRPAIDAASDGEKESVGYEHWRPVAPSAVSHNGKPPFQVPDELDRAGIARIVESFAEATRRADAAGFDIVEIHGAHGYLISEFLSPLANRRTDDYGGSRENRMRFALEVTEAVRAAWPEHKPLFFRISSTDGSPGGWTIEDSVVLAGELKIRGVDVVDCSSGGFEGYGVRPGPLYQVPFSQAVRAAGVATMAVGLITEPADAERVLAEGQADLIALARGALDNPNWPAHALRTLGDSDEVYDIVPVQARERLRAMDRVLGRGPAAKA